MINSILTPLYTIYSQTLINHYSRLLTPKKNGSLAIEVISGLPPPRQAFHIAPQEASPATRRVFLTQKNGNWVCLKMAYPCQEVLFIGKLLINQWNLEVPYFQTNPAI
jgi:hypothetical protein